MKQSTMEAYAEVDTILNFMDKEYISEIPEKLRNMFREKKAKDYIKNIVPSKPLEEQELKDETLSILAVLNYNYWCKDESEKEKLLKLYADNEKKYQEILQQKFNQDEIFKKNKEENQTKDAINQMQMIEYKEPFIKRLINKIKSFFR
mgnify:CR=1 FL=1